MMNNWDFSNLLSFAEAASIWGLNDSTLRKAVAAGRLKAGEDCVKYGKQWVIRIAAMCRLYGTDKYVRWVNAGKEKPSKRKKQQQVEGQIKLE